MPYLLETGPKWKKANYGQLKMAVNKRSKGHANFILCPSPTNLTIVLILSYILTSLLEKWPPLKIGQLWQTRNGQ